MIQDVWKKIPNYYPGVAIDAFQIMPNHVHGIIVIDRNVGAGLRACPGDINNIGAGLRACPGDVGRPRGVAPTDISLFDVIERFKSLTTHLYIRGVKNDNWPSFNKHLWQRNYYEHIIRNDREYGAIRQYAENNAINWEKDNLFI